MRGRVPFPWWGRSRKERREKWGVGVNVFISRIEQRVVLRGHGEQTTQNSGGRLGRWFHSGETFRGKLSGEWAEGVGSRKGR